MTYLVLSIVSSTAIFILFKLFNKYKINTLQAIVVNYLMATTIGLFSYESTINFTNLTTSAWFFGAVSLGILFIIIFNVMALTAQNHGISIASVASKMSVIIPIIFGIYFYNESAGIIKIIGIILALIAVYMASVKVKQNIPIQKSLFLPGLLFLGSGVIETSLKYLETTYVKADEISIFSATIFAAAAFAGILIIVVKISQKNIVLNVKSIPAGLVLGSVNYCSIYFILKALQFNGSESSTIFTINNVSIVTLSALVGYLVFKEHLSLKNSFGIVLAIVSILLITLT